MERLNNNAITLKLLGSLRTHGSWGGETHLQKAAYLLKEMYKVPLNNEFVLYKHGPFSFDLREELAQLRTAWQIQVEPQPAPFGPKLGVSSIGENLLTRLQHRWEPYKDKIEEVAQWLFGYGVKKLEQLATAWCVVSELPSGDRAAWQSRLQVIKPHVGEEDAQASISEVLEKKESLPGA